MEIGLFEVYLFLLMDSFDENEQSVFVNSAVCNVWTCVKCSVWGKDSFICASAREF